MKQIMFTRPDGGLSIIIPAAKEAVEKVLGPMTDEEYRNHIIRRSIPDDAINPREVAEGGIPESRELRDAWVDSTSEAKVDISVEKAKDIYLKQLRAARDEALRESDIDMTRALESGTREEIDSIKQYRTRLRDATDPLKNKDVSGLINDNKALRGLKELAVIPSRGDI